MNLIDCVLTLIAILAYVFVGVIMSGIEAHIGHEKIADGGWAIILWPLLLIGYVFAGIVGWGISIGTSIGEWIDRKNGR